MWALHRMLASTALALVLGSAASAQLAFDPPAIDLGAVKAGQLFERTVRVTNAGPQAVTVRELKSSCGCLSPKLEPMTLAPGQAGTLKLQINTLSNQPGPQGWRIVLAHGGAGGSEFLIRAELVQELTISPASLAIFGGRRTTMHHFAITDTRAKPLRILKAQCSSPLMEVGPAPTLAGSPARGELTLTIREGFPEGKHEERVTLITDDAEYPRLVIPVTVTRKPTARFTATPMALQFSREGSERTPSKLITLRDALGQPLHIERLEADHPALTAEVVKQETGYAVVRVTVDRGKTAQAPDVVRLRVWLAEQPQPVSIPVRLD